MRIVIDKSGVLRVERSGEMTTQHCPFAAMHQATGDHVPCGDWCPHFREPNSEVGTGVQYIDLCHGKRLVGQIEDKRVKEG